MERMTVKEVVALTGRAESWLRSHYCGWCDRMALDTVRSGCGAMFETKEQRDECTRRRRSPQPPTE